MSLPSTTTTHLFPLLTHLTHLSKSPKLPKPTLIKITKMSSTTPTPFTLTPGPTSWHNTHSQTYDRVTSNATFNIAKEMPGFLPPTHLLGPDSLVLDAAAGTGVMSLVLKQLYPTCRIVGSDIAPKMLEIYKQRAAELAWSNIDTKISDVRTLEGFSDESFTHIFTNMGFVSNVEDKEGPEKAARSMYRVLKRGGCAVTSSWARRTFTRAFHSTALIIRPDETPFSWNIPPTWNTAHWLAQQFEEAGFGNQIEIRRVNGKCEADSLDELVGNMLLMKEMFFKGYSEEENERLPKVLGEEIEKLEGFRRKEGGGVEIGMVAWVCVAWK